MAQLKDSLITGDLRVTGTIYGLGSNLTNIDAGNITSGTLPVSRGGTGATTFTSGALLIGNGTNAVSTRSIKNMTTAGNLGWTSATTNIDIPTVNTLAYWNGRYNDSTSNLAYCNKGAFGNAVTYGVDDATANGALGTGTGLTTERSVYYGLVTVNNASQTRATGIYAPTSAGTANQILVSAGGTSAPTWKATANGAAYATSANGALTFGTLPVAQGGTGQTSIANIQAGKDGDGNTISSTYLKLSGGTMTGALNFSGDGSRALTWNDATYQQRILTIDDSTANTNVFNFQQSENSGSAWKDLMSIKDTGSIIPYNGLELNAKVTYTTASNTWQRFITQRDKLKPFSGHIRIYVTDGNATPTIDQQIDVNFISRDNSIILYGVDSSKATWSGNTGIYYLRGITNKNYSTNTALLGGIELYTNSTASRRITVYPIELQNCYINDTLVATTYNSTYQTAVQQTTCTNRRWGTGLGGGADSATIAYANGLTSMRFTSSNNIATGGYAILGFDKNNIMQPISVYSASQTSNTTGVSAKGTRVYNTTIGFDWSKNLWYKDDGAWWAKNTVYNTTLDISKSTIDFRYTDNCVASNSATNLGMVISKPVFLKGYIKDDGLFYLLPFDVTYNSGTYQRVWTQDVPIAEETNGNYPVVYWMIGYPYYDSSYAASLYRINLTAENKMYWYKDGSFKEYSTAPSTALNVYYNENTQTLHLDYVNNNEITTLSQTVSSLINLHASNNGTLKTVAQEIADNGGTITENTLLNINGVQFRIQNA